MNRVYKGEYLLETMSDFRLDVKRWDSNRGCYNHLFTIKGLEDLKPKHKEILLKKIKEFYEEINNC